MLIMSPKQFIFTLITMIFIVVIACLNSRGDAETLEKIKSNEISLYCNMRGTDFIKIDAKKVVKVQPEFDGHPTEYIFNNGYATQCYTVTN